MPAVTQRGRERRERLLRATADLVAERGFHSVGIAEIGAAAGVTGSAIYRHFSSKEEMLVTLYDRVLDELLDGARAAVDHPRALDELIARHVEFALTERSLISVWSGEAHNLPPDDRRRLRRKQRIYAEIWTDALVAARPDLSCDAASVAVHATFGLLNSVAQHEAHLDRHALATLLTTLASSALARPSTT
jgi:AcrR family transcriptional regulator